MFSLFRWARRRGLSRRPFPDHWRPHLRERVPVYDSLPEATRELFEDQLKVFAWSKHFIGARGMQITDEVKVVIAATAVRLTVGLGLKHYDRLTEIVVYPFDYTH
ncbi:MAG: zinc-dependent peptidase, partial [Myxococcales bacterium]|nr:zinc-dependent peptidase [Myxococcales bacterium]